MGGNLGWPSVGDWTHAVRKFRQNANSIVRFRESATRQDTSSSIFKLAADMAFALMVRSEVLFKVKECNVLLQICQEETPSWIRRYYQCRKSVEAVPTKAIQVQAVPMKTPYRQAISAIAKALPDVPAIPIENGNGDICNAWMSPRVVRVL